MTASCEPRTKAWSGGFALASPDPSALFPTWSFGKNGNPPIYSARSWTSAGINFGDDTATLTSYAYCRHELDDTGLLGRHGTETELDPSPR